MLLQKRTYAELIKRCVIVWPLLLCLAACASVPKDSFDAYRNSFSEARSASEDVILRGKIAAKALADDPANSDSPTERLAKLKERDEAADQRLLALETIDRYKLVLIQLAEGKSPKEVRSNLEKLGNSLTRFESSRVTAAVGRAVPYAGVAAEIVALVDDSMNRQKFLELVKKGGEPVRQIIDILVADTGDLEQIISQQIIVPRDSCDNRLSGLGFRFQRVSDGLQATQEVSDLVKEINVARAKIVHRKQPLPTVIHKAGSTSPSQSDLAVLRLVVDSTEAEVAAANAITAKEKAHRALMTEYKKLLAQTKSSIIQLEQAIELNRPAATTDFVNRALALREAAIKFREVN
jgi:hypothetical protein